MNRSMDQVLAKYTAFKKNRKLSKTTLENDEKGLTQISQMPVKFRFANMEKSRLETIRKTLLGKQYAQLHLSYEQEKDLSSSFEVIMSPQKQKIEREIRRKMEQSVNEHAELMEAAEANRHFMKDMWKQNVKCDTAMLKTKATIAEIMRQSTDPMKLRKKIFALENKLYNSNTSYSMVMKSNTRLREEIQAFLTDKKRFNELFTQILRDLEDGEELLEDLVNESTGNFEYREFAQKKLGDLMERCDNDAAYYKVNIVNKKRQLREMQLLCDFMQTKMKDRRSVEDKVGIEEWKLKGDINSHIQERQTMMYKLTEALSIWDLTSVKMLSDKIGNIKGDFHNLSHVIGNISLLIRDMNKSTDVLNTEKKKLQEQVREMNDEKERYLSNKKKDLEFIKGERERMQNILESNKMRLEQIMEPVDNLVKNTGCDTSPIRSKLGHEDKIALSNVLDYVHILNCHVADLIKLNEYTHLLDILADQGPRKFDEFIRSLNRERIIQDAARKSLESRREEKKIKEKDKMKEKRLRDLRTARRRRKRMMSAARSKLNEEKLREPFEDEYGEEIEGELEEVEEEELKVITPQDSSSDDNLDEEHDYEKMYAAEVRTCNKNVEFLTDSELNLFHNELPVAPKVVDTPATRTRIPGVRTRLSTLQKRAIKEAIRRNPFPKTQEDFKREILEKPLNIRIQNALRNVQTEN